jgi:NAD(P)-dependent dehydrogenase (short-subunit alcohol dehydrogenase family)
VAIVTGGASGIGGAAALLMAEEGASAWVRSDPLLLERIAPTWSLTPGATPRPMASFVGCRAAAYW